MRFFLPAVVLLFAACSDRTTGNVDARSERGMCYVDFPCRSDIQCVSSTSYQPVKTDCDCATWCGGPPCSGCTCAPNGPIQSCPAGKSCLSGAMGDYCGHPEAGVGDMRVERRGDRGADAIKQKCFIDFPCRTNEKIHCLTATTFEPVQTDCDCMKYCYGASECSGCVCVASGPAQSCPTGQICIKSAADGDHCGVLDGGVPKLD
jgi:hypothetical protein